VSENRRAGLLLMLTVAYLLPLTQVWGGAGDAGTLLYGAQRVSEGQVPGRDFFEVMGPGSFYWLGLFFDVFGKGWQVTRLQLLLTGVGTVGLLYSMARQVCGAGTAVLAWLFVLVTGMPLWPETSHHWDSNLFAVAAVWCYLRFEKTGQTAWVMAAGGLAAVTACFLQQKGVYLLAALVVCAVWKAHGARLLTGGFGVVALAVVGYFWQAGALPGLFYANVMFPLTAYRTLNALPYAYGWLGAALSPVVQILGKGNAIAGLLSGGIACVPVLVLVTLPLLLAVVLAAKREWPQRVLLLTGAAIWISELHRPDVFHLAYGSPVLAVALFGAVRNAGRVLSAVLAGGLLAFGGMTLAAHVSGVHNVETRRGTVQTAVDTGALEFLCTHVQAREWVFVYPYNPIYYFLADVRNPTRFSILLYGYNTDGQFAEVVGDLESKRVPWVVWNSDVYGEKLRTWFPAYRQPAVANLRLERYLQEHYEEADVTGGVRVLRRVR
jgi:hypothetical protein